MGALDPLTGCDCQDTASAADRCGGTLPDSPDCAINYHFGMLLGVDDFRSEQGFHVGRLRRHQRALHGWGVVYGYAVSFDAGHAELRVESGYAVDRRGRDLYLGAAQCLSLPAWWDKHRDDDAFADIPNKDDATFDADVLLCYGTCLSRPVPAIADPCAGSSVDIAYSRICESAQLRLVRRRDDTGSDAAAARIPPYHLLRLLTGLDDPLIDADGGTLPDDLWLAQQLAAIAELPAGDQGAARATLWQAVIARAGAATSDPTSDPLLVPPEDPGDGSSGDNQDCLVVARLSGIHVFQGQQGWQAALSAIDIDQRMTLLPTQVLQAQLLRPQPAATPPALGPVVVAAGAAIAGTQIELQFDRALAISSVTADAFVVAELVADNGWTPFTLGAPAYTDADHSVTLPLDRAPTGTKVRVTVRGTGPAPLLAADLTPAGFITADGKGTDLSITISREIDHG